ncbi:hypothetical protein GCM10009544_02260 [Streptomyces stramineus]|uniref:GIY-YIG domain-containing protein n=1 Tax=Streptomyces stramineus TaxID=173861 RepID=A0ABP3J5R3_9ACTN
MDPRDGERRYIGQSIQSLGVRLGGHRKHPSARVGPWLAELQGEGLLPRIEVVRDQVPCGELSVAEREEITLALAQGKKLFNVLNTAEAVRGTGPGVAEQGRALR